MPRDPQKLLQREENFCLAYAVNGNGAEAARVAGYAHSGAKQRADVLLKLDRVQARLAELRAEQRAENKATAESVIERTNEVINRCMQAVPVTDRKGNIIEGEWTFDAASALRGLDLLGKHFGLFTTRIDVSLSEEKTRAAFKQYLEIVHQHVSKDQFRAILADLEAVGDA